MNNKEKLTEVTMLALQGKVDNKQERKTVLRNQLILKNQLIKLKESYLNEEDFFTIIDILLEYVKEELYNLLGRALNV